MQAEITAKKKFNYIGAPACFALELALQHVVVAFGGLSSGIGCFVVGSALERPDWRDVDIRLIMPDELFNEQFPKAGAHWEFDPKWLLLTVSISSWLKQQTGLPIDFQFQPESHANARFNGRRDAIGLKIQR